MKIITLNHQNNNVGHSNIMSNIVKNFDILATSLSILHNYFDGLIKLFLDLYLAKFLDALAKLFFPCTTKKLKLKNCNFFNDT